MQEQKKHACHGTGGVRQGYPKNATLNLRDLVICEGRRQEGCSRQRFSLGRKCPSPGGQQIARVMNREGECRMRSGAQAAAL